MLLIFGAGGIAEALATVWPDPVRILPKEDVDVRDATTVRVALMEVQPDHVVVTAGVSSRDYKLEIETNLIGSLNVATQCWAPTVLIASLAGLYGKPGHVGYSASKAGVISAVQSLALEGRPIWAVSPGRVNTPMRERDYPGDTPGSRLEPVQVAFLIWEILIAGLYPSGSNVLIRKQGLDRVVIETHEGDGWRQRLRVGEPATI